jgi:hypothetical protein
MPGKKGSGLHPSEKELPEWQSGTFHHKKYPYCYEIMMNRRMAGITGKL